MIADIRVKLYNDKKKNVGCKYVRFVTINDSTNDIMFYEDEKKIYEAICALKDENIDGGYISLEVERFNKWDGWINIYEENIWR